ncbi:hypothetical protein SAY86_030631 [Trapa natans]|uniref:Prolamin-like domain-containing protein n=1 Tax=Trapa natans TaxID=22666 RepID=A0AAN7RDU5_TRANT|nr:hypothetical protein SAY86_030631 [Trapa natans]
MIGVGKVKQYSNVLDKPLNKGKQEVSLSAFAFLFSELVQYNQTQVDNIAELERSRLEDAGYAVGARVLELLCHRERGNRRETRLLGILSFVHSTVWKVLFGKAADSLEKGTEHEDEYMISEKELLVNRFISIPKDMGTFNCGAFVAGIVRGVLDGAGFPAVVTAHFVPMEGQQRPRTTILIKFSEEFQPCHQNQSEFSLIEVHTTMAAKPPSLLVVFIISMLYMAILSRPIQAQAEPEPAENLPPSPSKLPLPPQVSVGGPLQLSGAECWTGLRGIKGCIWQIYDFLFAHEQNQIGRDCCYAFLAITEQCWPKMFPQQPLYGPATRNQCEVIIANS